MFIGNIRYAHHYADKGKKKIVKKDTMIQKKNALKP